MINLLIRLISFTICICLLVGGAMLSYNATKDNEKLAADWQDVVETPWLAGVEVEEDK